MSESEKKRTRQLKDLNVIDNFLFGELCADTPQGRRFVQIILETVLERKVVVDSVIFERTLSGTDTNRHSIRMDAYILGRERDPETGEETEHITIYDVEPDNTNASAGELARRNRYYSALEDVKRLESSEDYSLLPDMVSIFIMSYDPFGQGAMYYEARTTLTTHPNVEYKDGLLRIYLYVKGDPNGGTRTCGQALINLLHYIGDTKSENALDETTRELDRMTSKVKEGKEAGRRYMRFGDYIRAIKREAAADGKKEGLEKGIEKGKLITQIRQVRKKLAKGESLQQIAEELEEPEVLITSIREAILSAGDASEEEIADRLLPEEDDETEAEDDESEVLKD